MEMINFEIVHKPRRAHHHFLLPNCHYMLIGPTGCGKTNTLSNMLLQWICPEWPYTRLTQIKNGTRCWPISLMR